MKKNQPRILFWDIETSQMTTKSWGLWNQNINPNQIVQDWHIICISYKWHHRKKVKNFYLDFNKSTTDDYEIVKQMREVLMKADCVVGHNGDKYDLKKFQSRLIYHKLPAMPPIISVDTLKEARKVFKFSSNKLDYIAQYLGVGAKMDTGGIALWEGCAAGSKKALSKMVSYCNMDVLILQKVYERLLPYMKGHPNLSLDSENITCPKCNSPNMVKKNLRRTAAGIMRRQYQCKDCGGHYTLRAAEKTKSLTQN